MDKVANAETYTGTSNGLKFTSVNETGWMISWGAFAKMLATFDEFASCPAICLAY